jgi:SAM-dependent methyltransferase
MLVPNPLLEETDLLPRGLRFDLQYLLGDTPWDTGVTPPEVKDFVEDREPGSALDLGCGTGKNAVYLAQHGWQAMGVDISFLAILQARWRAWRAKAEVRFYRGDVTDLSFLEGPLGLCLDIGCLHSLPLDDRGAYACEVARLTYPGGWYLLYAFAPRDDSPPLGIAPQEVEALFAPAFVVERQEGGEDPTGPPSAWYWLRRRSQGG